MKTYLTNIKAIDPLTGELTNFAGPDIQAPTLDLAFIYCQKNGLGYCFILGELLNRTEDINFHTLEYLN